MSPFGQAWIQESHFHDLTQGQVLGEVARRVSEHPEHPLVLLDLDSTLYEVGHRSLQILKEWAADPESAAFPEVRARVREVHLNQVGYSIKDTFSALGLSTSDPAILAARDAAKKFWGRRFFTNEYLKYDHAYPGAAVFTRKLHELGAEIVYLTGRDKPGMGAGTEANLIRDGFPWKAERTHLLLKPDFRQDDLEHKQKAADYIRKHGTLVASFENEPPNLIALYKIFPDAMHIFVETVCSDSEALPGRNLYRIRGFDV